ncbi:MAG: magnesium transporter [Eubacteriales bacterium]|nr:magnesium transporter [Eubacteriales bacterium]
MTKKVLMTLLQNKKYKSIHEVLSVYNPVDVADLLETLDAQNLAVVFRMIEKEKAAEVFAYMDNDQRQKLIDVFSMEETAALLDAMSADDAVDFLEDMPANVVTRLLDQVDWATRSAINRLLQYPEDSAGSIMTVEFIELHREMTVRQALDHIRKVGIDSETVYTCYVVERHKLEGIITAKDLMIHDDTVKIADLMSDQFLFVHTTDDQEFVANQFRKYGLIAIPVVDSEGCIVGIVTFDDAMDVLTEETTEDMHKMAALTSANEESYLKTSVFQHAKSRIVWLMILMFSATITGSIITRYEDAFSAIPLLVSFIPMLMDTGGNCGSQSSTLIIRGLAVGELHFSDTLKVIWKEFRVAAVVSVALAVANGIRIYVMYHDMQMAIVIAASLVLTVIVAKMVGCLLPIAAKKCHLDPAIMASPLITTIVDTCSIVIYFRIATVIFAL